MTDFVELSSAKFIDLEEEPYELILSTHHRYTRVLTSVYKELPEQFLTRLLEIAEHFDDLTCSVSGCYEAVGYYLWEGDYRAAEKWAWTTLVQFNDNVLTVCEEHSPSNLYWKGENDG